MKNLSKVTVHNPIIEIDGDEMAHVMWQMIKDSIIKPFLDIPLISFDLSLINRDRTNDQVTIDAAEAIRKHRVGLKCATITPTENQLKALGLKKVWKSPNATIRDVLDGMIIRKPIVVKNIQPIVRSWKKPIAVARHAYGDIYKNVERKITNKSKAEIVLTSAHQKVQSLLVHKFEGRGILQAMYNTENSIRSFARLCIEYACSEKLDLWFAAKDTISKTYHGFFRDIFQKETMKQQQKMQQAGIRYEYYLIDDAAARILRHEGGILWACMNYEGDIFSDLIAAGFGSLGLMTSVLISPSGAYEYEAAHGTVHKHYERYRKGEATSTNPTASIFAWTGALRKRGQLDNTPAVISFADQLEHAVTDTIESGIMTSDLVRLLDTASTSPVTTETFIKTVVSRLSVVLTNVRKNKVFQ